MNKKISETESENLRLTIENERLLRELDNAKLNPGGWLPYPENTPVDQWCVCQFVKWSKDGEWNTNWQEVRRYKWDKKKKFGKKTKYVTAFIGIPEWEYGDSD